MAVVIVERLDVDAPFELDVQVVQLFEHAGLGFQDIEEVWASGPLFYPATPRAHRLMAAEVAGRVRTVPLAPSRSGDRRRCRPIGCYSAVEHLARRHREDR